MQLVKMIWSNASNGVTNKSSWNPRASRPLWRPWTPASRISNMLQSCTAYVQYTCMLPIWYWVRFFNVGWDILIQWIFRRGKIAYVQQLQCENVRMKLEPSVPYFENVYVIWRQAYFLKAKEFPFFFFFQERNVLISKCIHCQHISRFKRL